MKMKIHQKDTFNLFENQSFGLFYDSISNCEDFFISNKYKGLYPSEVLDITHGNRCPKKPRVKILW